MDAVQRAPVALPLAAPQANERPLSASLLSSSKARAGALSPLSPLSARSAAQCCAAAAQRPLSAASAGSAKQVTRLGQSHRRELVLARSAPQGGSFESDDDEEVAAARAAGWNGWDDDRAPGPTDSRGESRMKLKGQLRERELAELRRLVQYDERFGRALDRSCQAMHEVVANGNPAPVLALLAGLVWTSLCVAWELEGTNSSMPKARLRTRLVLLEEELLKVKGDLQKARSFYLKELTTLRDQLRRLDGHWEAEVIRLVYEEEPVMYYEPLQYLDEALKEHVVQIVEEKLKLAVARLQRLSESDASAASAAFMTALEEKSSRSPMLPKQKGQQSEEEAEAAAEMADKVDEARRMRKEVEAAQDKAKRGRAQSATLEAAAKAEVELAGKEVAAAKAAEGDLRQRCSDSEAKAAELQSLVTDLQ
ncbi:unnamed protein product, partial [Polarella glacialis]